MNVGSLLQHQFEERLHVTPTLQLSMVSKPDATYFVVKEEKWNYALLYNVSSHETTRLFGLPGSFINSSVYSIFLIEMNTKT